MCVKELSGSGEDVGSESHWRRKWSQHGDPGSGSGVFSEPFSTPCTCVFWVHFCEHILSIEFAFVFNETVCKSWNWDRTIGKDHVFRPHALISCDTCARGTRSKVLPDCQFPTTRTESTCGSKEETVCKFPFFQQKSLQELTKHHGERKGGKVSRGFLFPVQGTGCRYHASGNQFERFRFFFLEFFGRFEFEFR